MKFLFFLLPLFSLIACSNGEEILQTFLDCNETVENYKPYEGEEIDCQFHFDLAEFNGKEYIELKAHCADLTRPFVFNENCEDICGIFPRDENSECGKYLNGRTIIRTILIEN